MDVSLDPKARRIVVWLPSPIGDAVLCTPALRALRRALSDSAMITFYARTVVRQILSPTDLCDHWIEQTTSSPFAAAEALRPGRFTDAVLMKNSFGSALACGMAGIPRRVGYVRQCRGLLLSDRIYPLRDDRGRFKPQSMIDYYLAIAKVLGAGGEDRSLELEIDPEDRDRLAERLPEIGRAAGPLVVMVPGGAFGPSKCWPPDRFARIADWLIEQYRAAVAISVSPSKEERLIADRILDHSRHSLIHLGRRPLTLGQLKALLGRADLIITNDTGPRHIAIALKRRVITLFGPNDPAWTETDWPGEVKLIGQAPCVPCQRPICKAARLYCMESINLEDVCLATEKVLGLAENSELRTQNPEDRR
jgi:heptosyltransferase II